MLVSLQPLLSDAQKKGQAVAGFNVFGYGWARELVKVAEELNEGVILMVNPGMANLIRPKLIAPMLLDLAKNAKVPVCLQLDHGKKVEVIAEALDAGFSSVMYDGSALPLEENLAISRQVVELARKYQATVEGEVGTVRYTDVASTVTVMTDVDDAARYAAESGVDALAVSVGSTHRSTVRDARIDYPLLAAIHERVSVPLVIHGTSGIPEEDLVRMPAYGVAKYNIATLLRMAYGERLRKTLQDQPDLFDKLAIEAEALKSLAPVTRKLMALLAGKEVREEAAEPAGKA